MFVVSSVSTFHDGVILFLVTGLLWEESTSHQRIPLTNVSDAVIWFFFDVRMNKRLNEKVDITVIWDPLALIVT